MLSTQSGLGKFQVSGGLYIPVAGALPISILNSVFYIHLFFGIGDVRDLTVRHRSLLNIDDFRLMDLEIADAFGSGQPTG
jgi:hypothetical protein